MTQGQKEKKMAKISKGIRIKILIIMIENLKVDIKGNLHYNPNGLNVENGIKVSENILGRLKVIVTREETCT